MTCPQKRLLINVKLDFAKQTQIDLGYVFNVKVAKTYYNCVTNTTVPTGEVPSTENITMTLTST